MDAFTDEPGRTALLNEIQLAPKIVDPNVVQVLYVHTGSSQIGPYLVMEFASGGTLQQLLCKHQNEKSMIPMQRAREMMVDIAQGAKTINEHLIHRDIKPDNILIDGKCVRSPILVSLR